jgi:hypothetical protein
MKGLVEKLFLQDPDELSIDHAYRSMSRLGNVTVSIKADALRTALKNLEKTGFVGMTIAKFTAGDPIRKIQAFKGKHGPCFDKGQEVIYHGAASAALDDDHHLFIKSEPLPVCEKTALVMTLPPYKSLVRCKDPAQPDSVDNPVNFKYDHMVEDQEKLLKRVEPIPRSGKRIPLFYPGPFRLLILGDGTIIHRGKVTSIPESESAELMKKDGFFRANDQPEGENEFFQEEYDRAGIKWMYDDFEIGEKSAQPVATDFSALSGISVKMKERLFKMLGKKQGYFLLTGSDPADRLGCCPSDEVGEANRLVQAGILESYAQAGSVNSCPVTFYAFKEEIKLDKKEIKFAINTGFREEVLINLNEPPRKAIKNSIKWILLIFVLISVLYGIYRLAMNPLPVQTKNFYERLASENGDRIFVLLFHYHKRCYQCLNMEKFTADVLHKDFQDELKDQRIEFKLIDMDLPENRPSVRDFGFFSPMIVLVDIENGKQKKVRVVGEAWKLFDDESRFKALLSQELEQFVAEKNE